MNAVAILSASIRLAEDFVIPTKALSASKTQVSNLRSEPDLVLICTGWCFGRSLQFATWVVEEHPVAMMNETSRRREVVFLQDILIFPAKMIGGLTDRS